jgi:hypothetical protein
MGLEHESNLRRRLYRYLRDESFEIGLGAAVMLDCR